MTAQSTSRFKVTRTIYKLLSLYVAVVVWISVAMKEGNCVKILNVRYSRQFWKKHENRIVPRLFMNWQATRLTTWSPTLAKYSSGLNFTCPITAVYNETFHCRTCSSVHNHDRLSIWNNSVVFLFNESVFNTSQATGAVLGTNIWGKVQSGVRYREGWPLPAY